MAQSPPRPQRAPISVSTAAGTATTGGTQTTDSLRAKPNRARPTARPNGKHGRDAATDDTSAPELDGPSGDDSDDGDDGSASDGSASGSATSGSVYAGGARPGRPRGRPRGPRRPREPGRPRGRPRGRGRGAGSIRVPTRPLPPPPQPGVRDNSLLAADVDPFLADPDVYKNFEHDPALALLLLAHNTGLNSWPALSRLRDATEAQRADPAVFDALLEAARSEVTAVIKATTDARQAQVEGYTTARNPRAPLLSCAACGVRERNASPQARTSTCRSVADSDLRRDGWCL